MQILGIDHIQIAMPVGGEAEARNFYGNLLGLTEIAKPEPLAARGGCWFEGPNLQLHLGVQPDFVAASKAHPCLVVSELDGCRKKLEAAGISIIGDNTLPNVKRFYASDPFGNRLEFIQNGDGFSQQARE